MVSKRVASTSTSASSSADRTGISTTVEFSNLTSRAVPLKGQGVVDLTELHADGVVIDVPLKSCAKGHQIMLELRVRAGEDPGEVQLNCTGQVRELRNIAFDRDQVTVEFIQVDERKWVLLKSLFSSRQTAIDDFLRAARGY